MKKSEILSKVKEIIKYDVCSYYQHNFSIEYLNDCIKINATSMYENPCAGFTLGDLIDLSELFGTKDITSDEISESGCETCDYWSKYGYTFYVKGYTLEIEEDE